MADLVEAMNDVASRVEAWDAGPLMSVAEEAAVLSQRRSNHFAKLCVRVRAQGRIYAVKGVMALRGIDDDTVAGNCDSLRRSIDAVDLGALKFFLVLRTELQGCIGCD